MNKAIKNIDNNILWDQSFEHRFYSQGNLLEKTNPQGKDLYYSNFVGNSTLTDALPVCLRLYSDSISKGKLFFQSLDYAIPSTTSRSIGTRLVISSNSSPNTDCSIGMSSALDMWINFDSQLTFYRKDVNLLELTLDTVSVLKNLHVRGGINNRIVISKSGTSSISTNNYSIVAEDITNSLILNNNNEEIVEFIDKNSTEARNSRNLVDFKEFIKLNRSSVQSILNSSVTVHSQIGKILFDTSVVNITQATVTVYSFTLYNNYIKTDSMLQLNTSHNSNSSFYLPITYHYNIITNGSCIITVSIGKDITQDLSVFDIFINFLIL